MSACTQQKPERDLFSTYRLPVVDRLPSAPVILSVLQSPAVCRRKGTCTVNRDMYTTTSSSSLLFLPPIILCEEAAAERPSCGCSLHLTPHVPP